MFSKRNLVDIKKSTAKIQDVKKDLATRQKHLKIILDNVDAAEAKGLFEANFSHIYHILYDSFIQAETNLRQRELSFHLVHKAHKEELECALWILEQVLCLLPELIHKRWQLHSLGRLLSKLLHPGNSIRVRRQAIRYFLMWYQALEENAPDDVDTMFASLVPGFVIPSSSVTQPSGSVFHDTGVQYPVTAPELLPILPPTGGEKSSEQSGKIFLEALLEYMVTTVVKLEWHDKGQHHHRCFHFLLEMFKKFYLPKICRGFDYQGSVYVPNLELPVLRKPETETIFVAYRVILIKWVATYMHQTKKPTEGGPTSISSTGTSHSVHPPTSSQDDDSQHESTHPSLDSTISLHTTKTTSDEDLSAQIVYEVLCSSRDNVNFVHEMYRQSFLLNFNHAVAVRKTIAVYKDLVQMNFPEIPPYMLEPQDDVVRGPDELVVEGVRPVRLRTDSYLGAIQKENLLVRAGSQNLYQLFMTHAANVFMLEVNPQLPALLEEQTDACKRVLNIYRYMVMHTRMDSSTWEQLLVVLLQITSLVLGETPPKKKSNTLGGKLAPAIFQTLIVTWIKANLNVVISCDLWDRFLHVLMSLTNWEELVKEWAKTLETLTRVLARHVYNLDLTDLPLNRLSDQKTRRTRKTMSRPEGAAPIAASESEHPPTSHQDTAVSDVRVLGKNGRTGLPRSYSETNLAVKQRAVLKLQTRPRKSHSLDNLPSPEDIESMDRTRSPSPAPSSGLESTSVKDSPIQLDVLSSENNIMEMSTGEHRGVVCGGSVRGWLPDVAVVLWRRMLSALGDVNRITDPRLHGQVFEYLVKLTETLIKIKRNQGVSPDNQSTPQPPELVPPLTLILPWCFGALALPDAYEAGKINSLRLLCTVILNCDVKARSYLPQFYRCLHFALCGQSRPALNTCLRYLGPRFLSLQLRGSSILLLDLVHACNLVLNSSDLSPHTPRTEAVSILANLLSLPDDLSQLSMLQPEPHIQVMPCPDIKEHVVSILLRTGRKEPTGMARCIALSALGLFVYRELTNHTFHPKVADAVNVLLLALKFNNKVIAHLVSNTLFLLCDHAPLLWAHYPRLADAIISTLCKALFLHTPLGFAAGESDKALGTALLLCVGEWCMRLGPAKLLEVSHYGDNRGTCLLLQVFDVLHTIIVGEPSDNPNKLVPPIVTEDFDPCILLDNLDKCSPNTSPSKNQQCQQAITLCAKTVLAHLVTHLGHFPMAIGAARLSSLVAEHDDVPNLSSDELSSNIFTAANIQLFILTPNVIASLVELPALELPGGGVTAGLATADKQVRVILRDLSGKACWDASILYRNPEQKSPKAVDEEKKVAGSKSGPQSGCFQMESMAVQGNVMNNLPQRAMRHRAPGVLPEVGNSAPDLDQLDDLLQYLGHTSPECLENCDRKLNEPTAPPVLSDLEGEAIASVINQRNCELEHGRLTQKTEAMLGQPVSRPSKSNGSISGGDAGGVSLQGSPSEESIFQKCRLLFSQLGLATWERRHQVHLLNKTDRLLRELRNLDLQSCRETHKVAVIYVAPGQEDKNSILSNQGGSAAYEQFLAALAWEVELESHTGFLGGLQRQGSTGLSAPYVATSFYETIFHVATRMPNNSSDAVLNKIRHLGNDEVHVVWSEHSRDYRRDIIPTEFCDILVVIYPLGNNLNRVTIHCKPEVPYFGILPDEAIVESNVLAGLIRTAAVCASRAKRSTLSFYQQYYEERARSLDTVVTKHKDDSTYEEFISRVYSPMSVRPHGVMGGAGDASSYAGSSSLTAALLDSSAAAHKLAHRGEQKFRALDSGKGVWFNNSDANVESTSISPRPLKKLSTSLKGTKRSLRGETVALDSPPDSPTQILRRK